MGIAQEVSRAIDRQTSAQNTTANHLVRILGEAVDALDELAPLVDVLADIRSSIASIDDSSKGTADALWGIYQLLKSALGAPPNPGALSFELTGENGMITGNVKLPDFNALSEDEKAEITSGKLTVTRGSGGTEEIVTAKDASVVELNGAQDDTGHLEFVYIDNSGNPSKVPATLDISFPDSVPPVDPAALGWEVTGETPDPV